VLLAWCKTHSVCCSDFFDGNRDRIRNKNNTFEATIPYLIPIEPFNYAQAAFVLPLVHPKEMDLGLVSGDPASALGPPSSLFLVTIEVPADAEGEMVGDLNSILGVSMISGQTALSSLDTTQAR
jgi:hypothetical protein